MPPVDCMNSLSRNLVTKYRLINFITSLPNMYNFWLISRYKYLFSSVILGSVEWQILADVSWTSGPMKMGPIAVTNYHLTLRKIPEERGSQAAEYFELIIIWMWRDQGTYFKFNVVLNLNCLNIHENEPKHVFGTKRFLNIMHLINTPHFGKNNFILSPYLTFASERPRHERIFLLYVQCTTTCWWPIK